MRLMTFESSLSKFSEMALELVLSISFTKITSLSLSLSLYLYSLLCFLAQSPVKILTYGLAMPGIFPLSSFLSSLPSYYCSLNYRVDQHCHLENMRHRHTPHSGCRESAKCQPNGYLIKTVVFLVIYLV